MATAEEKFAALIEDLHQLAAYLHSRGDKTLKLSQQFAENARRDTSNKRLGTWWKSLLNNMKHRDAQLVHPYVSCCLCRIVYRSPDFALE